MSIVHVCSTGDRFRQEITVGDRHLVADEPVALGGNAAGPAPFDLVLAGLGACQAMTVKLYAERKGWALRSVKADLEHQKIHDQHQIHTQLCLDGDLTDDQRQSLLEIADRCPVHKLLTSEIDLETTLVPEEGNPT